jgi:putative ABC transport system permease protein
MENLLQDVRTSIRMLRKKPGFTILAALALALGIGANTAIFSVVNAVLLSPLPFEEPERLVWIWSTRTDRDKAFFSIPDFIDSRERNQTLEQMVAFANWGANLTGAGEPERIQGVRITPNAFQALGAQAIAGRALLPEDGRSGERVAVLSHGLWQRRFGASKDVIGSKLSLSDDSYTVVGVLPADFIFPGTEAESEIAIPLSLETDPRRSERGSNFLRVFGRLKPGVTLEQARADLAGINDLLRQQYPEANAKKTAPRVLSLHDEVVGSYRAALLVLLGAVGFVLLIACSNLANLLLVRASARHKEIAVRVALGATRTQVIRLLLTESLALAILGGLLGIFLASWGIDLLVALSPAELPRATGIGMDGPVLGFTLTISLLSGLIFGLVPALQASNVDLIEELKGTTRSSTAPAAHNRTRSLLVVAEVAISLVLLTGAGLLVKSFRNLQSVSPGFEAENLLSVRLSLPQTKYSKPEAVENFYQKIVPRIESLSGVETVGAANVLPLSAMNVRADFTIVGRPPLSQTEVPAAQNRWVSPSYFQTLRIAVLKGRQFTEMDTPRGQGVVMIDKSLADRYWPGADPLGAHIKIDDAAPAPPREVEIIGVVENVKHFGLDEEPTATVYAPLSQIPQGQVSFFINRMSLVVRTSFDPLALADAVRHEVRAIDGEVPTSYVRSMEQFVSAAVAPRRFSLLMLAIFSAMALLLATSGVYAVISYAFSQRTHEIGVRLALGAQTMDVLRLVIGHGLKLVLTGVALGLVGAFALTRVLSGLLYGVTATDPVTFVLVSLLLTILALAACAVPAWRATKVDPGVALRYE